MTLHILEEIICRVHALDPDSEHFGAECWELSSRIMNQRIHDMFGSALKKQLDQSAALLTIEVLLMWEALLAHREQRAPSFANVVKRLRDGLGCDPKLPDDHELDAMERTPRVRRQDILHGVLKAWVKHKGTTSGSLWAWGTIDDMLKKSIGLH